LNIGCTTTMVTRLETTLERHVETTGRKVIILGQSRGGWLGRIVAMRRPDLVGGLIMLASAVLNPLAGKAKFLAVARFIARLGSAGLPGVLDQDCLTGQCYRVNRAHLLNPLPSELPAVSVYSRHDEIAPWALCRDPSAEHAEVHSTHTGMALNPDAATAALPRLTRWASWPRRQRAPARRPGDEVGHGTRHVAPPAGRRSRPRHKPHCAAGRGQPGLGTWPDFAPARPADRGYPKLGSIKYLAPVARALYVRSASRSQAPTNETVSAK